MNRKLLVVGSNSIHVYNFIDLVREYFDDVLLLTNEIDRSRGVKSIEMDFTLGINSWKTISKIHEIVEEYRPSVIHIQQANTYAFLTTLATKNLSIPRILTAWGSDVLINPKKSFLLKKMLQYILSHVEVVTADSNHVLNTVQSFVGKKLPLYNINFGINIKDCPHQSKKNIIYSNRMHKELYNIDKIIYSFARFHQDNADWKLVVAGSGDSTEQLKDVADSLGIGNSVEFVGFLSQEENYRYYCESKIYVSIPNSDSVSISLVEAMICGCVPFVSSLEANKEIVDDGRNGFIVKDLENIDFCRYLEIEKDHFEKTREALKIYFSKEYNKNRYIEIYREIIK